MTLMNEDWFFSGEGWICDVRVAGVLVRNGKILLQRERNGLEYAVPGGHIKMGETLEDGLRREWREETGAEIRCQRMLWTEECFWEWQGKKAHNLSFYYRIALEDAAGLADDGALHSHKDNSHILLEWVKLETLENILVYPAFIKEALFQADAPVRHFVTRA